MADIDHAILVGISRYGDTGLRKLDGPPNDVELMEQWLLDANGGGLLPENVRKLQSDEAEAQNGDPEDRNYLSPLVDQFVNALYDAVGDRYDALRNAQRPGSRLYLYFSGHGFSEKTQSELHASLYAGNCRLRNGAHWNIYGTHFARWVKNNALFDEIVLVMDCCRDAEGKRIASVVPMDDTPDPTRGNGVRLLEIYAAPRGGKAHERPIPSRGNNVYGLLTHALEDALRNAVPGKNGVTCADIKAYLANRWDALCEGDPVNPPLVRTPDNGEILFVRPAAVVPGVSQVFDVSALLPLGAFRLVDASGATLYEVGLGAEQATVTRVGGAPTSVLITHGRLVLNLPMSFYKAAAIVHGQNVEVLFQPGGPDVQF